MTIRLVALDLDGTGRAQISTLPVFLGLLGGVTAFGPIGLVVGPVVVALTLTLLRFAEEARAASALAHPNIVAVLDLVAALVGLTLVGPPAARAQNPAPSKPPWHVRCGG